MEKNKLKIDIDLDRTSLLLKIGIIGATMILVGDMLMGWGIRDTSISGIEGQVSQYLTVSDSRMLGSFILGLIGVPLAAIGHFGIYKLIKPYTEKYARLYAIGALGFIAFGGAGVHGSSIEAAFFYKYMTAADPKTALASSIKFALYFLLPLYILLIICWIILIYAHIRAILSDSSPYPSWCLAFSMLVGTLIFNLVGLLGNYPIVNALKLGASSMGNIWSLAGHLFLVNKLKAKLQE